jgi:hypothetical protein
VQRLLGTLVETNEVRILIYVRMTDVHTNEVKIAVVRKNDVRIAVVRTNVVRKNDVGTIFVRKIVDTLKLLQQILI